MIAAAISSTRLREFLASQGVPKDSIMVLGSEFECPLPDDLDDVLATALEKLIAALKIKKPSQGDTFLLPLPFCVQYAELGSFAMMANLIRQGAECSKAWGTFGYMMSNGNVHALNFAVHSTTKGKLSLVFREPQRHLEIVKLSQKEIESCAACICR